MNILKRSLIGTGSLIGIYLSTNAYKDYFTYNDIFNNSNIYPHSSYYYLLHKEAYENTLNYNLIKKNRNYSEDLYYLYHTIDMSYYSFLNDKELSYMNDEQKIELAVAKHNFLVRRICRRGLIRNYDFSLWFRCLLLERFNLLLRN